MATKLDPRQLKDDAQEAVTRGKWKKALEGYQSLEKLEPRDGTWPQRAGEMYRKLGQRPDAVAALSRAAEAFSASGFLLKAVAVSKIILELDPDNGWTRDRLAQLSAQHSRAPAVGVLTPAMPPRAATTPSSSPPVAVPAPPRPAPRPSAPPVVTRPTTPGERPTTPSAPPPVAGPAPPPRAATQPSTPPPVAARPARPAPPPPPPRRPSKKTDTLEDLELFAIFPDAQQSREIALDSVGGAIEIPLDDELDDEATVCVIQEDEAGELARQVFPRTPLFNSLDQRRLGLLIASVALRQLGAGETVFEQGGPGDALYVVSSGEVAVSVSGTEVARLGEGAFFGEIALIARQARNATVKATQLTDLLVIPRDALMDLIEDEPAVLKVVLRFVRDRLLERLMSMSPLFAPFSPEERRRLAARFRFIEAEQGATLVAQGHKASGLFVLLAGSTQVFLDGAPVAELGPGQVIGEISLLGQAPASATIVTARRSYLLEMPRGDFAELIMTHPQVLEHLNDIAERRQQEIAALRSGQQRYGGEARLTIV